MFNISSVFIPEVSICILSHGGMKIKAPRICMSTMEQESQTTSCVPYSMWDNIKELFSPESSEREVQDENITITPTTLHNMVTYDITYSFIDLPYIPSYLIPIPCVSLGCLNIALVPSEVDAYTFKPTVLTTAPPVKNPIRPAPNDSITNACDGA